MLIVVVAHQSLLGLCLGEKLCGHLNFLNQCFALFSKVSMELLLRSCMRIKTIKLQVYFMKKLELLTHHFMVLTKVHNAWQFCIQSQPCNLLIVTNKVLGHYLSCLLNFFQHVNFMEIPFIKNDFGAKPLWIAFPSIHGIHLALIHGDTWMKTHGGGTALSMLEGHNKGKLTLWRQDPTWHLESHEPNNKVKIKIYDYDFFTLILTNILRWMSTKNIFLKTNSSIYVGLLSLHSLFKKINKIFATPYSMPKYSPR
jgi:hypothetical protein